MCALNFMLNIDDMMKDTEMHQLLGLLFQWFHSNNKLTLSRFFHYLVIPYRIPLYSICFGTDLS